MASAATQSIGTKRIDDDVCIHLRAGSWDELQFSMAQMTPKEYQKVKKVMESLGGKWSRKAQAIVFKDQEAKDSLMEAAQTGTYVDLKKAYQQFDTPSLTASELIEKLEIPMGPSHGTIDILEPSGGNGAIIRVLNEIALEHDCDFRISTFEIDPARCELLRTIRDEEASALGFVSEMDFLEEDNPVAAFDFVAMNPPFTRSQDIDHVMHAFKFLKPGGTLAAIMSPGWTFHTTKKATEFRDFVTEHGDHGELPEGTFKASGTNIRTTWVVLTMPEEL